MKIFGKLNTVYYRLLISYILLLIITTILIGVTSYAYFSMRYNNEIRNVNNLLLNNISREIRENIIERISNLCIDVTMEQRKNEELLYYFKHQDRNNVKLNDASMALRDIVLENIDIISSISIYYRLAGFISSSASGLTFIGANTDPFSESQWMKKIKENSARFIWIDNKEYSYTIYGENDLDMLSFIYLYCDGSVESEYQGFIKVDVDKKTLQNVIEKYLTKDSGMTQIVNSNGDIICNAGNIIILDPAETKKQVSKLPINNNQDLNSIVETVGGKKSVVSYSNLTYTGWTLINTMPLNEYYTKTNAIKQTIILICVISVIFGFLLSGIFSFKIYNPIGLIVKRIRNLAEIRDKTPEKRQYDYGYINGLIDNLSIKVNEIESTIEINRPLIKYNLIQDLIFNNFKDSGEIGEQLKIAGISMPFMYYHQALMTLDPELMNHTNTQNTQFIKYNLISYIENCSDTEGNCIAASVSRDEFVIIANSNDEDDVFLRKTFDKVSAYLYNNFTISAKLVVGGNSNDIMKICELFDECKKVQKYLFFYPEVKILTEQAVKGETNNGWNWDGIRNSISVSLNKKDIASIDESLKEFIAFAQGTNQSCEYLHQRILDLVYTLTRYIKEIGISSKGNEISQLFSEYQNVSNVSQFKEWFVNTASLVFYTINDREKKQKSEMLQKVQKYIIDNLDKDISLNFITDMVGLSPNYLSRIYREETGCNFVDFVKEQKMNKARELLQSTSLTIEEISQKLGYGSSAYFIKKFRESFGVTPSKYR